MKREFPHHSDLQSSVSRYDPYLIITLLYPLLFPPISTILDVKMSDDIQLCLKECCMAGRKVSLILIDSHMLFLEGLQALLQAEKTFDIISLHTDTNEGLLAFKEHQPDIVILSDCIAGMSIITMAQEILLLNRSAKIIILAGEIQEFIVLETIKAGVTGFLSRCNSFHVVLKAIQRVVDNQTYYCDQVSQILAHSIINGKDESSVQGIFNRLTNREKEIMIALLDGRSINSIAGFLHISRKTVTTHKSKIFRKFNITNIVELVRIGNELGF